MTGRDFLVFFQEAALASQLCLEESRKEHSSLLESVRQLRKTLEELQDQKAELEAQVDLLQCRSQRLQKRIGCVRNFLQYQKICPVPLRNLPNLTWASP